MLSIGILITFSILNMILNYSNRIRKAFYGARSHSFVESRQLFAVVLILMTLQYLRLNIFGYAIIGLYSVYMIKLLYNFLPFHNENENILHSCKYLLSLLLCCSFYISYISIIPEAFFILLLLYPLLVIILSNYFKLRISKIKAEFPQDVYEAILFLRFDLLKKDNKAAVIHFLNSLPREIKFNSLMVIWESRIYRGSLRMETLAAIRLFRWHYSNTKHQKGLFVTLEAKALFFKYCRDIEAEYSAEEHDLLVFAERFTQVQSKDVTTSLRFLEFLERITSPDKSPGSIIENRMMHLMKDLESLQSDYISMKTDYVARAEAVNAARSFLNLMATGRTSLASCIDQADLAPQLCSNQNGVMIVSGMPDSLGEITYINSDGRNILKVQNQIGKRHLNSFLSVQSKNECNEYLKGFLMFGDADTIVLSYFPLLDSCKSIILTKMRIRIRWYNRSAFIIFSFYPLQPSRNILSYKENGVILQKNSSIYWNLSFMCTATNLCELHHDLYEETWNHRDFEPFILEINEKIYGILTFPVLANQNNVRICIIFSSLKTVDELTSMEVKNIEYLRPEFAQVRRRLKSRKLSTIIDATALTRREFYLLPSQQGGILGVEVVDEQRKDIFTAFSVDGTSNKQEHIINNTVNTLTKMMRIGTVLGAISLLLIMISLLLLIQYGLLGISDRMMINELGFLRAHTTNIAMNIRSLSLMNLGYEISLSEGAAKAGMVDSADTLIEYMNILQEGLEIGAYYKVQFFREKRVKVMQKYNSTLEQKDTSLTEAIRDLAYRAKRLAELPLSSITTDKDDFYYIYRNAPNEIIVALNETVFSATTETIAYTEALFIVFNILQLVMFIPALLILVFFIPSLVKIEKINRSFWSILRNVPISSLLTLKEHIQSRLNSLAEVDSEISIGSVVQVVGTSSWKRIAVALVMVQLFFMGSFSALTLSYFPQFLQLITLKPSHEFWWGLSRMMSHSTFYWVRETYLEHEGESAYKALFSDNSYRVSPHEYSVDLADSYVYLVLRLVYKKQELQDSGMINDIGEILAGDACKELKSIEDCPKSIVSLGTAIALRAYTNEIRFILSEMPCTWSEIIRLQRMEGDLNLGFEALMDKLAVTTEERLNELGYSQLWLTGVLLGLLALFIYFILCSTSTQLQNRSSLCYKFLSILDTPSIETLAKATQKLTK